MKIESLIDQLYWISKFGRPVNKISSEEIFKNPSLITDPIFFLSTGRCGTEWFTYLLKKDKKLAVFHDPKPNFSVQNKFIFQLSQDQKGLKIKYDASKNILFAGREQYFRYAYKCEKRYVETNNHITFFADALATLFPTAKFVHLYRHPGDFVTSGMNRGWFGSNLAATEKIISPIDSKSGEDFSRVQKISWVWNETNAFIEYFKKNYKDRVFTYNFSEKSFENLMTLFDFLEVEITKKTVKSAMQKTRNAQKKITFPKYMDWSHSDKVELRQICGVLCEQYQFEL